MKRIAGLNGVLYFTRRPLLCVTLCAMLGIGLGRLTPFHPAYVIAAVGGVLLYSVLRRSKGARCFLLIGVMFAGMAWCGWRGRTPTIPGEGIWTVRGSIQGAVIVRDEAARFDLTELSLLTDEGWQAQAGSSYVWVQHASALSLKPGDSIELIGRLTLPEGQRNPGGFDWQLWLRQRGDHFSMTSREAVELLSPAGFSLTGWIAAFGNQAAKRLDALFGDMSPLFRALILGDRSVLPDEWRDWFAKAGIVHLLAVSGLHVGFLYNLLEKILRVFRPNRWLKLGLLCLFLGFYAILTGLAPSVLRASMMCLCFELARALGRKADAMTCMSAAALLILIARPFDLFSPSFQMSFGAVCGIILLVNPIERRLSRLPKWLRTSVGMSIGAQLGALLPVVACYGWFSWISLLTNLVAIPIVAALFPTSIFILMLDVLWHSLASVLAWAPYLGMRALHLMAVWVGSAGLTVRLPATTTPLLALGFALSLFLGSSAIRLRARWRLTGIVALMAAGVVSVMLLFMPTRYVQLDVGQASAGVLHDKGACYVYDVGETGTELINYLLYTGDDIDALYLSHGHSDHVGGLEALLDNEIAIGRIYLSACSGGGDQSEDYGLQLARAAALGIEIVPLAAGDTVAMGGTAAAQVLWPPSEHECEENANRCSLVMRVAAGHYSLLWTGDIEGQDEPLRAVDCDVLQVAHHGSRYSTGNAFLRQATPAVALISSGRFNTYGHPHPDTLARLEDNGAIIFRTDQGGAVTIRLDRPELIVSTHCEGAL